MAVKTRKEIRDHVKTTTRETQIDSYINEYINLTLSEINDPAWAYEQTGTKGYSHYWTFLRRKHSISVSAETAQLPRDVDKIGFIRQTDSPVKLFYLPDDIFYEFVPNPTATGNPTFYRLWEEEGTSTRLSTDDTVKVVSSSTSDSTTFAVTVVGYDTNGIVRSDVLTLNGTTEVNGTVTFDSGRVIRVSKSGKTTGTITVSEKTAGTSLVVLGPEERSPRFKIIGLYPIPTAALTLYLEYYTTIRLLENDSDVPDLEEKWIWVVVIGTMAKVYQYQGKEALFTSAQGMYAAGVRSMIKSDLGNIDYIPGLRSHFGSRTGKITFSDLGYGSYGLTY